MKFLTIFFIIAFLIDNLLSLSCHQFHMNPLTGLQLNRTIDCETDDDFNKVNHYEEYCYTTITKYKDHTFNIHGGCSYICTDPKNDCVMKMAKDTHFCCCATDDCNRFHGTGLRH